MFEWRGKIGLLISARNLIMEQDFHNHRPRGVSIHTARIKKEADVTNFNTMSGLQKAAEDSVELLLQAGVDVGIFGCTAASFINGPGQDLQISKTLQEKGKIKVITASTAVLQALRAINASKLTIITPYIENLNTREYQFFTENGFNILGLKGMNIEQTSKLPSLNPKEIYHFCVDNFVDGSDCLFISCTNIRSFEVIPYLEMQLGVPVITSNQASFWAALKEIGINDRIDNCGSLLSKYNQIL